MIDAELRARIRRLFFAEHWKVGTIATELGVHHDTVRARHRGRPVHPAGRGLVRPSMLDPYKAFIAETLEQHPRLRATRLFEMVRDRGYRRLGRPAAPLRRARCGRRRKRGVPAPRDAARRAGPGGLGPLRQDPRRPRQAAALVLRDGARRGRARCSRASPSTRRWRASCAATSRRSARSAACRARILYDNLKSVVLERAGDHIRFNSRCSSCAGHYHFAPKPCAPYRGNEKGKVERTIQYLRHGFFAARRFSSVRRPQRASSPTGSSASPTRARSPAIRPAARARRARRGAAAAAAAARAPAANCDLVQAGRLRQAALHPLRPQRLLDPARPRPASRSRSSPPRPLVRIIERRRRRVRHPRPQLRREAGHRGSRRTSRSWPARSAAPTSCAAATGSAAACPSADAFVEALALRGEHLGGQVSRLLKLLDRYDTAELEAALKDALAPRRHRRRLRRPRPRPAGPRARSAPPGARRGPPRRSPRARPPRHPARPRHLRRPRRSPRRRP